MQISIQTLTYLLIVITCVTYVENNLNASAIDQGNCNDLPRPEVDWIGCSFEGADLRNADLRGAKLIATNLKDANLEGADLSGADLHYEDGKVELATLNGANLKNSNLTNADLMRVDLRGADLSGADLRYAGLSVANLGGANLTFADMRYANLYLANFQGADLSDSKIFGANINFAIFEGSDLTNVDLTGLDFYAVNWKGANLQNKDFSNQNFYYAKLQNANFSGTNLQGTNLAGADLSGSDLRNAILRNAKLFGASLVQANLQGADLRGTDLHEANLNDANLQDANLSGANLQDANIVGANLQNADLTRADLYGTFLKPRIPFFAISKAEEEGWRIHNVTDTFYPTTGQVFRIPYKVINATVEKIIIDSQSLSGIVSIRNNTDNGGFVEIVIPRNLMDATSGKEDDSFFVLIDGEEAKFQEPRKSPCFRSVLVGFSPTSKEIEIIGTFINQPPRSQVNPVHIVADKYNYAKGEVINVLGCTDLRLNYDEVNLKIIKPDGTTYKTYSIKPKVDGSFSTSLATDELVEEGSYGLSATYGNYIASQTFVVPEFPVVALILVVSMVTLLTITRTKLKLPSL